RGNEAVELVDKFVDAKLVGIFSFKVGILRVEVSDEFGLGGNVARQHRDGPGPRTGAALGITHIWGELFPLLDLLTPLALALYSAGYRRTRRPFRIVAPLGIDDLAVVTIGAAITRGEAPEKSGAGLVDVRNSLLHRILVPDHAFVIVGSLAAAVIDLPVALGVIAGDSGYRPVVPVATDFAGVVEVVQHSKLERELVLVRSDIPTVHGERLISVAGFEIAKQLIVGAILLNDVDDVLDRTTSPQGSREFCANRGMPLDAN